MPAPSVEDLSNDDLLVQLDELCEEVGLRLLEYEHDAEDRETLAEAVSFANAARIAVECKVTNGAMGSIFWATDRLQKRAADARLARPAEREAFDGFLDEHPELEGTDDA
jgi:hypothetical protein